METKVEENLGALKVDESANTSPAPQEDFVDPWNVTSQSDTGIDYDKLMRKYILCTICMPGIFKYMIFFKKSF